MTDSKITEIQHILTEVDTIMRERLKTLGVNVRHVILAMSPDGVGILRSNVGEYELGDMADLLAEISEGAATQRPDNEPLN